MRFLSLLVVFAVLSCGFPVPETELCPEYCEVLLSCYADVSEKEEAEEAQLQCVSDCEELINDPKTGGPIREEAQCYVDAGVCEEPGADSHLMVCAE